jgi:peptide/bleomycin uptake transporter
MEPHRPAQVNNQRVEAALRRELVLLEADPEKVQGTGRTPAAAFRSILADLSRNYLSLYLNFAALGAWLSAFEQFAVVLPYLLVAPRLFAADEADVLTLGQLMKVTNSFGKVFDSLNIVSDNWLAINEWRSVLRRLREFERRVYDRAPPAARLVPVGVELSDAPREGPVNGAR